MIRSFLPLKPRIAVATVLCLAISSSSVVAEVVLPNIFSDHMVLQRRQENRVWGKASPNERVTLTIGQQSHEVAAGDDGAWQVMLDPMEAGEPMSLVVKCPDNEVSIDDVIVGEVWICAGQSNMEFTLSGASDSELEISNADCPEIRTVNFPNVGSQRPVWSHPNARWVVCTPQTAGSFSAVGYFFARKIHDTVGVPVGLINNSWAGSRAEAWVPREYIEGKETLMPIVERYDAFARELLELDAKTEWTAAEERQVRQLRTDVNGDDRPANAYNGIVASHVGYGIRGVLWYQGEGNAPRAHQYRELFPLAIESWRNEWGQGDFPFYWVQLPNYQRVQPQPSESEWAELREAQTMTMVKLPNTGQAVTIDVGDGDLHPRNKKDIGQRLADWALARDYEINVPYQSPQFQSMKIDGGKITLSFDHVDEGLSGRDGQPLRGFAIAGEDRRFVWANAISNDDGTISVSSDQTRKPVAVRYAWADNPVCNVYDGAGFPLTPFRTDDWPGLTLGVLIH